MPETLGSPALWWGFGLFVLVMLGLDLGVFHRKAHRVRTREALGWVILWIALAAAFNGYLYHRFGDVAGKQFTTGYLLELALSVDNLFVFIVIFRYFSVPAEFQHRVLFWGILGALILRAAFIVVGAALIHRFHWILYGFGIFLIFTGGKLLFARDEEMEPGKNPVLRLFRKFVPLTNAYEGQKFLVRAGGRWAATPLLLVLVMIEATDVVFATDSIPAIFGVTDNAFIIYTSNIFAIMGLRSMFFLLSNMMAKFRHLKVGLGLVLVFIGMKMLLEIWEIEVPIDLSLGIVAGILAGSVVTSFARPGRRKAKE